VIDAFSLFRRMVPLLPAAVESKYPGLHTCIFATRVAIEVAAYFGIEARAVAVQVLLVNAAFAKHIAEDDADCRKWAGIDGSHSVGIGFGYLKGQPVDNTWNGHLIAVADGCFGDFSIQQAERPDKGIATGPGVVSLMPQDTDTWTIAGDNGVELHYHRIFDSAYLRSPDWRIAARRRPVCARLIRILREVYDA
jgi:hypothetical protein